MTQPAATMPRSSFPELPDRIKGLAGVVANLSWSWNRDARALFRSVDQALWHLTRHNPIELLRRVDPARLAACAQDPAFLQRYDAVIEWNAWVAATHDTWFETSYPDLAQRRIAYFCAEFGLHNSVPIYSGGLGVLAGDHCKAASDLGVPLVGVGLFYKKGYSDQRLRQEWILGVGGVRVLRALGYDPTAWHANEGHAAFMLVERVRELVTRGTTFPEAVRRVRSASIFTTHTPVPAGHDTFSAEQVEQCMGPPPVWQEMGVSREQF